MALKDVALQISSHRKDKRIAFGRYPEVGLAEARRKREKLLAIYNGANSFSDIAKEYIDKMVAKGRADTTTTKANWLLEQLRSIASQAVADLKPIDVLRQC